METEKEKVVLRRLILILLLLLLGAAFGYLWHMMAIARAYEYVQPAGRVTSDRVKAAMLKMGPLYDYRMVGETLYVDTGSGWQRLRH